MGRVWLFRLGAVVIVPCALLCVLELFLRLSGYGYPADFAIPHEVDGESRLIQNDRFAWTYMPPGLARSSFAFSIPPRKSPDTVRIFVLGGSAAMGTPLPSYGFSRMLRFMLESRHPGQQFEIINAAITAINSHVVRRIAAQCARLDPDLFIVYMGNNEVVGPYGAGTVFTRETPSALYIHATEMARSARLGQLVASLPGRFRKGDDQELSFEGMEMFQDRRVARDAPALDRVYDHFRDNLRAVFASASRAGIPVILSTVQVNMRHCPPFGSAHREDLGPDELESWQELYDSALGFQEQGAFGRALELFDRAGEIDHSFAALHYRMARCLEQAGHHQDAARRYRDAVDHDTLRFRADSRINEIIREEAEGGNSAHVHLVDSVGRRPVDDPRDIPGEELFDDHVHFTFEGNYGLAASMLEDIEAHVPALQNKPAGLPVPDLEDVARRLVYTDNTRFRVARTMLQKFEKPPFTFQINHQQLLNRQHGKMKALQSLATGEQIRGIDRLYQDQVERHPDDWVLRFNFSIYLSEVMGEKDRAVGQMNHVMRLQPRFAQAHENLGLLHNQLLKYRKALDHLETALEINPSSLNALINLGQSHAGLGQLDRAQEIFEEVIVRSPDRPHGHFHKARLDAGLGRNHEALEGFQEAVRLEPDSAILRVELARAFRSNGRTGEALSQFHEILELDPGNIAVNLELGNYHIGNGQLGQAVSHFERIIAKDPGHVEARFNLASILFEQDDMRNAAEQFGHVVRRSPDHPVARFKLAWALHQSGLPARAVPHYRKALEKDPDDHEIMIPLAHSLMVSGQLKEAEKYFQMGLKNGSDDETIHYQLGNIALHRRDRSGAVDHFNRAVEQAPDRSMTHFLIADSLMKAGYHEDALMHFRRPVQMQPDNPMYLNGLAWILATSHVAEIRDGAKALRLAETACERTEHAIPELMGTLSAAQAESGMFDKAIGTVNRALETARRKGRDDFMDRLEGHLENYRAGQPVRENVPGQEPG